MSVVDAAVDDPLAENFRDDLANPLRADALLAGDLVIRPAFAEPRENPLPPRGLAQNIEPPPGCWSLFQVDASLLWKSGIIA